MGSGVDENNIYDSGSIPSGTLSKTVSGLSTNGSTVYVRLWYRVGENWPSVDYTYTASGGGGGGGGGTSQTPYPMPASQRFQLVLGGAAVLDKETGLVWEKSPSTIACSSVNAIYHCDNLNVGGRKGWLLPTVEELASLVDLTHTNPSLPSDHPFKTVQSWWYWSTNTNVRYVNLVLAVNFNDGLVGGAPNRDGLFAWCARGGQSRDAY